MAAGRRGAESTPLIGSQKRQSSFLVVASLSLFTVALLLVAFHSNGPVALQQKASNQQIMLAKALLHKGEDLEDAGQQDMAMAKLLLQFHGSMLAGNETNSTDGDTEPTRKTLEEHGVNVDMWPQNKDVKILPKKAANSSEYVERVVTKNHDWYNHEPLQNAGVNVGKWFWEDEDESGPPEEPEPVEDANATAANATDSGEEEEEDTPEERLRKAGIKVDGFPWEPVEEEEEADKEEEKKEEEEAEGEEAEGEEAAAKAPKIGLYQRGRAAYKQYQLQMAQRLHGIKKVH